ncbi:Cytochrome c-type biogenesis protein CcmC, putative heme lyase for CcmE [hydrothermal vent metagenome]|uniref:Cytochrome c-type biogenesis protein CcmC, putative heme lyase for CcmE n=1 Tax=hydrothermal vent metagenome TaxID=652676 RepID=A0A3B1A3G7_9ZZZZ
MALKDSIAWYHFSAPKNFYPLAGKMIPWFWGLTIVLLVVGLYLSFFVAPTDYKQGESYRIIYIHVPAAWMSMLIYLVMAIYAIIGLAWKVRLADMMASALAPTGAMFTFLALWTGAFWGKPTWGTYWVWDARLTSELILLFLYIGFISLQSAIDDPRRAAKASGLLAIVGVINLPIIYFSVQWWNTLHQGASVSPTMEPKMATIMLTTMLIMTFAFWMYTIVIVLMRVRRIILERERQTSWVMELFGGEASGGKGEKGERK